MLPHIPIMVAGLAATDNEVHQQGSKYYELGQIKTFTDKEFQVTSTNKPTKENLAVQIYTRMERWIEGYIIGNSRNRPRSSEDYSQV
ncbi:hypothetical protein F511_08661 [Dorcoceras hygrometricum]|uniref:Uncharacterized protein n=1 Tax=Dorcoceras hygrometricum TaxID=472368 RepID=A0A2Z7ABW6_9LAMI|nr:hypothetical protein F511_08661 [Dorcoceras hygrometricum]